MGQVHERVADLFFPRRCIGCGKYGYFLCDLCLLKLPRLLPPFCRKCGRSESGGSLCPTCWGWRSDIDGIRSCFHFDGIIRRAVYELKYHGLKSISGSLAELMADYLQNDFPPCEVLVPVPLHPKRLRQRGYNQSEILSRKLGELTGLPMDGDCLIRLKDSLPQARSKTVEERRRNVDSAFTCRDGRFTGKRVILVDDVCTSGSTLETCAEALKAAGAASVWGLTLARES